MEVETAESLTAQVDRLTERVVALLEKNADLDREIERLTTPDRLYTYIYYASMSSTEADAVEGWLTAYDATRYSVERTDCRAINGRQETILKVAAWDRQLAMLMKLTWGGK